MAFAVHTYTQPGVTGRDPTILVLDDGAGGRAEVWPALGFNCFRWVAVRDGRDPRPAVRRPRPVRRRPADAQRRPHPIPIPESYPRWAVFVGRQGLSAAAQRPDAEKRHPRLRLPPAVARRRPGGGRLLRVGDGRVPDRPRRPGLSAALAGRPPHPRHAPPRRRPAPRRGGGRQPRLPAAAVRPRLSPLLPSAVRARSRRRRLSRPGPGP